MVVRFILFDGCLIGFIQLIKLVQKLYPLGLGNFSWSHFIVKINPVVFAACMERVVVGAQYFHTLNLLSCFLQFVYNHLVEFNEMV